MYLGKCVGSDRNITKQEFDNRRLASSTTASPLVDTYCYNYDLHGDYYWKSVSGSCGSWVNISKQEYDNRQLSSTTATLRITSNHPGATIQIDGNFFGVTPAIIKVDKGSHTVKISKVGYEDWLTTINVTANRSIRASTAALSYSNNLLGYCYYPRTQDFYIKNAEGCAGGDLEITKQEFKNKTIPSAIFRFVSRHWLRAHCLGNVEFPCRFTYEKRTNKNGRIVIETKQGEIIFPDGSAYIGPFDQGMWHGHGTYTFSDKRKYTGQFKNGRAHGLGVLVFSNGARFDGVFRKGKKWWGTEFDKRGKIVASFSDGKRHPGLY